MHLATLATIRLPNHSVRIMAGLLAEAGADLPRALATAGLPAGVLDDAAATVTGRQEIGLQRAFCAQTPDRPDIWIELGTRYRLLTHAHTDYALVMSTAPTVEQALRLGQDYGDLFIAQTDSELIDAPDGRLIGFRTLPHETPADLRRFATLRDVGLNCAVMRELWGAPFPFDRVALPVPAGDAAMIRKVLPEAALTFDAAFACWRWSADLRRAPPHSDPILHDHYRQRCDRILSEANAGRDVVDRLTVLLERVTGQTSIKQAARDLGVSTRTLQRRLAERGQSFRELAVLQRHRQACRLLREPGRSVSQVAFQVGYDNVGSFNFAFRRMAGLSPSHYRRVASGKPALT